MTAFRQELQTALASDRLEDAADAYRRLVNGGAETAEDFDRLGRLAGRIGETRAAVAWLERAAAAPSRARWAALGEARTADGDHPGAEAAWRRAVEAAAENPAAHADAWAGLGEAFRELARWDLAAQAFRHATTHNPRLALAWTGLAVALANLGDAGPALAAGRAALDIAPTLPAAHRAVALAFLRAQRLDDAERACLAALEHAPGYPEGLATLALLRMMQNRLTEADALFHEATTAKPTFAEAVGNHAVVLARLGRKADAQREAARAIKLKSFLPAPMHLLGTLMRDDGRYEEAAAAFEHVLKLSPGHTDARVNLADTLRMAGRPAVAAAVCRAGLEKEPGHAGLLINLGTALQRLGDVDEALAVYRRALDHHPDLPEAHNNIARLHQEAGRLDEAVEHLRRAADARPQDADIARNLAAALLDSGRRDAAEQSARKAVRLAPGDPANHRQLAHVLARLDRLDEAETAIGAALKAAPSDAESCIQAAAIFIRADERTRAIPYCRQAIRLRPNEGRNWAVFAQALRGLRMTAPDPALRADLLEALAQPGAEHGHLMDAVVSAVFLEPAMAALRDAVARADANGDDPVAAVAPLLRLAGTVRGLTGDALLIALLNTAIVTDTMLERTLTVLRHALLDAAAEDGISPLDHPGWLPVLCALARQCFLNEYVFAETPKETAAVAGLDRALVMIAVERDVPPPSRVALFAAYRPLAGWIGGDALESHGSWPDEMRRLLDLQVAEPREEQALAAAMPRLTVMDGNPVSRLVRAQYESNPYPRWIDVGLLDAPMPAPRLLRALFPHLVLDAGPDWSAPEVLIAGCGTGRESVWTANQIAGARVLAVDLSLASLAYAQRQTRRLGIAAVDYAQADLMELGGLNRRFDIIQSVGVLHHLADPLAGWRVLTSLLRPGGLMKIGLYSERARDTVVAVRDHIARHGYGSTADEIRRFRQDILALPAEDPIRAIAASPDFHNISACRDLVFHVQEHRLTLPRIADWITELGLEFIGFQLDDPAVAHRYRRRFPEDPEMASLALWDRFEAENPRIFGGLYQFWVRHRP